MKNAPSAHQNKNIEKLPAGCNVLVFLVKFLIWLVFSGLWLIFGFFICVPMMVYAAIGYGFALSFAALRRRTPDPRFNSALTRATSYYLTVLIGLYQNTFSSNVLSEDDPEEKMSVSDFIVFALLVLVGVVAFWFAVAAAIDALGKTFLWNHDATVRQNFSISVNRFLGDKDDNKSESTHPDPTESAGQPPKETSQYPAPSKIHSASDLPESSKPRPSLPVAVPRQKGLGAPSLKISEIILEDIEPYSGGYLARVCKLVADCPQPYFLLPGNDLADGEVKEVNATHLIIERYEDQKIFTLAKDV